MQVLLVEDEPTIAVTLKDDLEDAGHLVTHVADGQQAIDLLGQQVFDWSSAPLWTCRTLRTRHDHTQAIQLLLPAHQRAGAADRAPPRVIEEGHLRGIPGPQPGERRLD